LLTAAVVAALIVLILAAGCIGTESGSTVAQSGQTTDDHRWIRTERHRPVIPRERRLLRLGVSPLPRLSARSGSVVGVDDIEKKDRAIEGRPYALAYGAQFKDLPLIGEFRGKDDPEKIIVISPQVIFKTGSTGTAYGTSAAEADRLQEKTGIPVVAFPYGSLRNDAEKAEMYGGLRTMGEFLGSRTAPKR